MSCLIARLCKCQIELSPCRGRLIRLDFERPDGGIDAKRLQDVQHLAADSLIHLQPAERNASPGAMIHVGALAVVAT